MKDLKNEKIVENKIPDKYKKMKKDVIYRCIGEDFNEGVIACGYMPKPALKDSQQDFVIGYYSCFIVLSGQGIYEDEQTGKVPINAGCFVQRFPGRIHSTKILPDGNWLEFFISFGKGVYDYMHQLNLLPKAPVIASTFDISVYTPMDTLLSRLKNAVPAQYPFILADMQKAVLQLCGQDIPRPDPENIPPVIHDACALLSADFSRNIPLPQIARQLNMGYESFRKLFVHYKGISPGNYRQEQRMRQACLMLCSGISIKETAQMTGYADTYSFTREFSKMMGMAPGQYRQKQLEKIKKNAKD